MPRLAALLLALAALSACSKKPAPAPDAGPVDAGPPWGPGTVLAPLRSGPRGLLDVRGLIHAHSQHSHDACDNHPFNDAGQPDLACLDDFRRGLCQSRHDFVMLSDHGNYFADSEYPEAMLYDPARGDALVDHGGPPSANWAACPDAGPAMILGGTETASLSVGLERHVGDTPDARRVAYGDTSDAGLAAVRAVGGVALLMHTENWTPEQLTGMAIEGFEMFNLHANTLHNGGVVVEMLTRLDKGDLPHPDLVVLPIISEDDRYLTRWASALAAGARRATTMGTDCHRNSFPDLLADGERIDSYRRMMIAFSNHLLVRPSATGAWDDRDLKEALRAARLYGAFEYLGYPEGFDYRAEQQGAVVEMGGEVSAAQAPVLKVSQPRVRGLDPAAEAPELRTRLLRADPTGWVEVASGSGDLAFAPTQPGAYRAEVRMKPLHLRAFLGRDANTLARRETVWIYSNAIYVVP